MEKIKRTACYIRVSTEEQVKHGLSISAQKSTLEKYCKEHDLKVADFYIDEGITARKNLNNRLEFQRMLSDIKNDKIDLVIFIKLDRFFRNVADYYKTMETFKKHNVDWCATEEDYDTTTSAGRLSLNIRLSIAQNESDQCSDRINYVFANRRKNGFVTSGTKIFGYDIIEKRYVENKKESTILKEIYTYFIKNNGSMQSTYRYFINKYLNISYDTFKKYLTNTAYIGKYKLYRKNEYIDNYTPQILDLDLFNTAQLFINKNKQQTKNCSVNSIFDKLLVCGKCGYRFTKAVRHRDNKVYISYHCWRSAKLSNDINKKYQCSNRTHLSESKIESFLLYNIKYLANNYIIQSQNISSKKDKQESVKDNSSIIKNKLNKLKDLYMEDLIDKDIYKSDYNKLMTELERNNKNLLNNNKDRKKRDLSYLNTIINKNFEEIYNTLEDNEKRILWLNIIDRVIIEKGKIIEVKFL